MVGTILGIGIVFALLAWSPPLIVLIVTAILAQGFIESVITAHYGLAVIGITVLSLMLFHLAAPGEDTSVLIGARLIDTARGPPWDSSCDRPVWPHATSARVPPRQSRAINTIGAVLAATWTPDGSAARLREQRGQLLADTSRGTADTDLGWPITVAIEELAYIAHSVPHTDGHPPRGMPTPSSQPCTNSPTHSPTRQYGSHRYPPYPGIPAPPTHLARSTPRSLMPDGHHSKTAGHKTGLLSLGRQHLLG